MKNILLGYRPITEELISTLWKDGLFVLDANVLLNLYRYSQPTKDEFIQVLNKLVDRLWIPHQAFYEYLKNRPEVILTQEIMYENTKKILIDLLMSVEEDIQKKLTFQYHPFIDKDVFLSKIKKAIDEIGNELDEQMKKHPNLLTDDPILTMVSSLLNDKIGEGYSEAKLHEVYKESELRYSKQIPPGYKDAEGPNKKTGEAAYGDLLVWFQMIDKATEIKAPIVFISNDKKEDWWWISKGRTIGPRPELVEEMYEKASVPFYIYNSDRFMEYAKKFLDVSIKQTSIDEVRDLRLKDESKHYISEAFPPEWASEEIPPENSIFIPDWEKAEAELSFLSIKNSWREVLTNVRMRNPQAQGLLNSCKPLGFKGGVLYLGFHSNFALDKAQKYKSLYEEVLSSVTGNPIKVVFLIVSQSKPTNVGTSGG